MCQPISGRDIWGNEERREYADVLMGRVMRPLSLSDSYRTKRSMCRYIDGRAFGGSIKSNQRFANGTT